MTPPVRLLLLVSWREHGQWHFLRQLRQAGYAVTVRGPWLPGGPRWVTRFFIWLSRFTLPVWAAMHAGDFDIIASWNLPYATGLGLLKRLLAPLVRLPTHLARDFHIDLGRASHPVYALKLRLLGAALPGIDLALTTSRAECAIYAARFAKPAALFQFFPDEPPSELYDVPPLPVADYVFAYGNSDRDFDTLLAAAARIPAPVTILSQAYAPKVPPPPNVTLRRDYVSRQELVRLIASARCCVVPLRDSRVAAGQNSMFEVMALGRPLVITDNIAVAEHVTPGRDVLTAPTGDAEALAACVRRFLDAPDEAEEFGRRARQSSREWLDRQEALFTCILEALPVRGGRPT